MEISNFPFNILYITLASLFSERMKQCAKYRYEYEYTDISYYTQIYLIDIKIYTY